MSELGIVLKTAREAAGISLRTMASRTSYCVSHLSMIENGKRTVLPAVVRAYERVLGVDGLADPMRRRTLLSGFAFGAMSPKATAELIEQAYVAALDRGVDDWEERAEQYGHSYMTMGAGQLKEQLGKDLLGLRGTVDRPALWGISGRLLAIYGKTTKGAGEAAKWYRLAAKAADRSGLENDQVWTRGRAALAFAYESAGLGTARELAQQAIEMTDKPSMGRLNAMVALAHLAAIAGNRSEAHRIFESCRRLFDVVGSYEQTSDFAMPEWRFAVHESMMLARLGDSRAENAQQFAVRNIPDELPRFKTHIELHRGLMQVRAGELAGGVRYAREAMSRLPEEKHSLSLKLMLQEVEQAATRATRI